MKLRTCAAVLGLLCSTPVLAEAFAPIRLNQAGLLPNARKVAVAPHASKQPLPWRVMDASGKVRASGRTIVFGQDRWSGEHVHRAELTGPLPPGSGYVWQVGTLRSRPFAVASDLYDRLPYDSLGYFYHNRAGIPIEASIVGERWARPAGHLPERATCVSGKDPHGNDWPGCSYTLDVTGGWYDAGDHGKYVVNGGITLWTLLNLFERNRAMGADRLFADGSAILPERGNGVSDLLDEARWEMEFFLKMQVPDGTRFRVPVAQKRAGPGLVFSEIDASGMAHHKVADDKWTALPMRPHQAPQKRQLFPPATGATLNLAATAAQCARIWRGIDDAFAARCLSAAEHAWAAAVRNPQVYPVADFTGSGGYGDGDFSDEFYWAAAELAATTGKEEYRRAVEASPHFSTVASEPGWNSVAPLGTMTLALASGQVPKPWSERARAAVRAASDRFLADRTQVGYAIPFAPRSYQWGSNSNLLNRAILLGLAHDFTRQPKYRDGVVDVMDYLLGRNPIDRSYISGYGHKPMLNPHHRFWAHSMDRSYPPPPPGAVSGGPNDSGGKEFGWPLAGKCAPQTCWVDDIRAYSLNEVAINWNAPLVWVSAWLADSAQRRASIQERG